RWWRRDPGRSRGAPGAQGPAGAPVRLMVKDAGNAGDARPLASVLDRPPPPRMMRPRQGSAGMKIKKGIKALVAEAEAAIETLSVDQVKAALADPKVQLIDIRDVRELW